MMGLVPDRGKVFLQYHQGAAAVILVARCTNGTVRKVFRLQPDAAAWEDMGVMPATSNDNLGAAYKLNGVGTRLFMIEAQTGTGTWVIFRSTDQGDTWTELTSPATPDPLDEPFQVEVWASDGTRLWITGEDADFELLTFYSTDWGDTWIAAGSIGIGNFFPMDFAVDPADSNRLAVACFGNPSDSSIAYSADQGVTWNTYSVSVDEAVLFGNAGKCVFTSTGRLVVLFHCDPTGVGERVFISYSDDPASGFTQAYTQALTGSVSNEQEVAPRGLFAVTGGIVALINRSNAATPDNYALVSVDDGLTWVERTLPTATVTIIGARYASASNALYVVLSNGVVWQIDDPATLVDWTTATVLPSLAGNVSTVDTELNLGVLVA